MIWIYFIDLNNFFQLWKSFIFHFELELCFPKTRFAIRIEPGWASIRPAPFDIGWIHNRWEITLKMDRVIKGWKTRITLKNGNLINCFCLFCFMTDYSIVLLIKGGNLSGSNSYQSLVQNTFGFPGFLILSALQFLYPFIGMFLKHHREKWLFIYASLCPVYLSFYLLLWSLHSRNITTDNLNNKALNYLLSSSAMISYNITTGDTLTKVFQRIPGGW